MPMVARHEAMTLLGLVGAAMAERLNYYRQAAMELDIADALEPIRSRSARAQSAYENRTSRS